MHDNYPNLTDCRDCREFVSKSARACPHCGAIKPATQRIIKSRYGFLLKPLSFILALGLILGLGLGARPLLRLVDRDAIDAEICAGLICDEYVVTATSANVREKPSTESPIVFTVNQGDVAIVLEQQENWMFMYFYNTDSQQGWIHNRLIEHVKTVD